jgi:hypothetical protein
LSDCISLTLRFPLLHSQLPTALSILPLAGKLALLDICKASADKALSALATPLTSADVGAGKSYIPGSYSWGAAMVQTGTVELIVPTGTLVTTNPAPKWIFSVGAAFATAAGSKIVFVAETGGAVLYDPTDTGTASNKWLADLVSWKVTGAVSLGANSHMVGNMVAAGAIAVGADASCEDLKAGGAITLGANAKCDNLVAGGAVTLGAGAAVSTGSTVSAAGAYTKGANAIGPDTLTPPTSLTDAQAFDALGDCNDAIAAAKALLITI